MSGPAAMNGSRNVVPAEVVDFVNLALNQTDRTGICTILKEIANATRSAGAILWELDPDIPIDDAEARLFTAGHWFRSGRDFAEHDLSLYESFMGWVLIAGTTEFTNNVEADDRCSHSPAALKFYKKHNIGKFFAGPIRFIDGPPGVLAVFRQPEEQDFKVADKPLLEMFCSLLPGLHDSLHHKVSFKLIDQIKNILQGPDDDLLNLEGFWQKICAAIRDCFHLLEASVFLEDRDRAAGEFRLAATTYEKYAFRKVYKANEAGKTSWAITNRKPLWIWDLKHRKDPKERTLINKLRPGITWDETLEIEKVAAVELGVSEKAIPPLSFIAQPIFSSGTNVCGILRCCAAKVPPYYFTHRERALLGIVAAQIGQFWSKWLDRHTLGEENRSWSNLVDRIKKLNFSVDSELRKQAPDIQNVLRKALENVAEIFPGGEVSDIRLVDRKMDELYWAHIKGDAWTENIKKMRLAAGKKPPQSLGAIVYQSGELTVVQDVEKYPQDALFEGVKAIMVAPIFHGNDKRYGVLDLRSTHSRQFPVYVRQMAELIGRQLGLYHALIDNVQELRNTEKQLKEQTDLAQQAFADWQHQIRGPINQAYHRLREVIRFDFDDYTLVPQYLKIQNGLLSKAKRAAQGLRLFLDLAGKETLRIKLTSIDMLDVAKLLVETCADNQALSPQKRKVDFDVVISSFQGLQSRILYADRDLLEQAVNNVIDNAFKYSYRQTLIKVSASDSGKYLCITVSNEGIPITEEDIQKLTLRGWRAENAMSVQGEGTGIGLWVVDHIMKAHDGRLDIAPTIKGRTEVKLLFPWKK